MRFEVAGAADDAEIRRILRENPMEGAIRLSFEREPDALLAGEIEGDTHQVIVARDEPGGPVVGMGARSILEAWVGGNPTRIGYLSQLRVDRPHRRRPRAILHAYRFLRELHADGAAPYYLTTIIEDNREARHLLEANLPSMPRYRPLERLVTLALPIRPRRAQGATDLTVRRAAVEDLDGIVECLGRNGVRFQFGRRWTTALLRCPRRCRGLTAESFLVALRGDRVAGCLALWDQRAFKQTVVRGYAPSLGLARPFLNLAGPWLGVPRLPRPGGSLRHAFLSHVALDGDDPRVLVRLVREAMAAAGPDLDHFVMGFAERDPLLHAVTRAFPCRRYRSLLYVVHWEDGTRAVEALDGRVPHPEVATL